ncbi:HRDC domain-containing protein [Candidatus Saccharibacteria bacterium]|nr:HRDC domain-containing protein [Candidatus Saccharibacteria bacterium]
MAQKDIDEALLQVLEAWRADEAARRSLPRYIVADNKTLEALARDKPATISKLKLVHGVGPKMIELYADDLLVMIKEHA